jgi:hypothetical protein
MRNSVENVAVVQALVLMLAIVATVCLPAVVALILCSDGLAAGAMRRLAALRAVRKQHRLLGRLDRSVASVAPAVDLSVLDGGERPTIEQVAADLRRLHTQRLGVAGRSRVWQSAVQQAYDERLRLACASLGVAEHLGDLEGVDLEIERLRVEGELQAAGLVLPSATGERPER